MTSRPRINPTMLTLSATMPAAAAECRLETSLSCESDAEAANRVQVLERGRGPTTSEERGTGRRSQSASCSPGPAAGSLPRQMSFAICFGRKRLQDRNEPGADRPPCRKPEVRHAERRQISIRALEAADEHHDCEDEGAAKSRSATRPSPDAVRVELLLGDHVCPYIDTRSRPRPSDRVQDDQRDATLASPTAARPERGS